MSTEEFYKEFFGVQGVHPNGTTINHMVIRFAEAYAQQQIKDGLAREKELNKMLDKWEEENLISIDEINKMKENSKHIHDGLKAAIEDKQQQIKELEEHSHQQAVTIRSYEEKIYTIKQALKNG